MLCNVFLFWGCIHLTGEHVRAFAVFYPTPHLVTPRPWHSELPHTNKELPHKANPNGTPLPKHQFYHTKCFKTFVFTLHFHSPRSLSFYVFSTHRSAKSQWHSATYAYIGYISFAYHTSAFTLRFPILDHEVFMFLQQTKLPNPIGTANLIHIASISFFVQPRQFPYVRTVLVTFSRSYNIVQESKRPEDFNHLASNYLQVASRKPDPHIQRRCRKTI